MFVWRKGLMVVLLGSESCLCWVLQVLGSCWAVGRGHTAPPGAQPWLFLPCLRHPGPGSQHQPHHPSQGAVQARDSPKPTRKFMVRWQIWRRGGEPLCRPGSGLSVSWRTRVGHSPMIVRQVRGDETGLRSRWGASARVRIRRLCEQAGAALQLEILG